MDLSSGGQFKHNDTRIERFIGCKTTIYLLFIWRTTNNLVATDVGKRWIIHARKCIEAQCALFMSAGAGNNLVAKNHHNSGASVVERVENGVVEVEFGVGKRICHWLLRACEHNGFLAILE